MKTCRKILALVAALALMLTGFTFAAAEETKANSVSAYLMYADAAWANQYWYDGNAYPVEATEAIVNGEGTYTVGLKFQTPAEGLAFMAVGIDQGEKMFPGYTIEVNAIRVNGEGIAFNKGYTSSDDGITTRMNLYNEWVSELPADARSFDGSLEGASPIVVDKEAFASVESVEVDFTLYAVKDVAYLMYADAAWANQYWYDGNEYPVEATLAEVKGEGTYTVGLKFQAPAEGLAFMAVGVAKGEQTFNGYFIDVTEVKVNGEAVTLGKGYTSSDDGITTRENLYNEWVSELPADARRADGDLEGASPIVVDKEAFSAVETVEVTFNYIYGEPIVKEADGPMTEDEAKALKEAGFHAYLGLQTTSYIFRNSWDEASYGRDAEGGYFTHLTGWDADNNAVDYGGTFVDTEIKGDGEYTVSLTTGDMGFGTDETFRLLFVSTDIPSKLVTDGFLTISDVKIKGVANATQEYTDVDTTGTYVRLIAIDEYNSKADAIPYTMPAANSEISFTFTVSNW